MQKGRAAAATARPSFLADSPFRPATSSTCSTPEYFLTHAGQRGPQTTILTPGKLSPQHLSLGTLPSTTPSMVAEGFCRRRQIQRPSTRCISATWPRTSRHPASRRMVSTERGPAPPSPPIRNKPTEGKLTAILVPVGCIGILGEGPCSPDVYYVNEAAYKITMMSTRVQTWEFKGGYIRRYIDLSLDQSGNLKQTETRQKEVPGAAGLGRSRHHSVLSRAGSFRSSSEWLAQVHPGQCAPSWLPRSAGAAGKSRTTSWFRRSVSIGAQRGRRPGPAMSWTSPTIAPELEHAVQDAIRPEGFAGRNRHQGS